MYNIAKVGKVQLISIQDIMEQSDVVIQHRRKSVIADETGHIKMYIKVEDCLWELGQTMYLTNVRMVKGEVVYHQNSDYSM